MNKNINSDLLYKNLENVCILVQTKLPGSAYHKGRMQARINYTLQGFKGICVHRVKTSVHKQMSLWKLRCDNNNVSCVNLDHVPLVVGSVGPYGAHLHDGSEYDGSYADTTSVQVKK